MRTRDGATIVAVAHVQMSQTIDHGVPKYFDVQTPPVVGGDGRERICKAIRPFFVQQVLEGKVGIETYSIYQTFIYHTIIPVCAYEKKTPQKSHCIWFFGSMQTLWETTHLRVGLYFFRHLVKSLQAHASLLVQIYIRPSHNDDLRIVHVGPVLLAMQSLRTAQPDFDVLQLQHTQECVYV